MTTAVRADPYSEGLRFSASGQHARAIERFEAALAQTPDDPRVLFALGNTARMLGLARPAEEFFRRVLTLEPGRVEAIINLANLLRAHGNFESAEALLLPALSRNPDAAEIWLTVGSLYGELGDGTRAIEHYRKALALRPNYAPALGNLADLLADGGDLDAALALYDRALRSEPDNAQARVNRAVLHLLHGNLKDGWRDYAGRLKLCGKVPKPDHKLPRWAGSVLKRERLLVTAEQGVGDQIMFASVVADLQLRAKQDGGSVILECEPRLVSLFARSFPSATVRAWDAETRGDATNTHYGWLKSAGGATSAIEMGSVPRYLRPGIGSFPNPNIYLVPDAEEAAGWRANFSGSRVIGICWRSGKTGGHRAKQFAPLEKWAEFVRGWEGTVVSVQYDASVDEITKLEELSGRKILAPQNIDQKNELDRTCALLSTLDAVISAPTAVSWLAAAAGVPTYKILYSTSWTSFGTDLEPFAPACLCMMPDSPGNWDQVFAKTTAALKARFSAGWQRDA